MTWISNLERFGREDGLWEGCTLGLKIGREEGRRQGKGKYRAFPGLFLR
jgi:hypothetical protein